LSEGFGLGYKIRQYMHGLLLLALAGVIIALVENVVASVPDIPLYIATCNRTTSRGYMSEILTENTVITLQEPDIPPVETEGYGNVYCTYYSPLLLYPPPGYKYVIVFRDDPELHDFDVWTCTGRLKYRGYPAWDIHVHGDYMYAPWPACIIHFVLCRYESFFNETVYIFVVRADTDIASIDPSDLGKYNVVRSPLKRPTSTVVFAHDADVDYIISLRKTSHYALYIPALPRPPPGYKYVIVFRDTDIFAISIEGATVYREIVNFTKIGDYNYVEWTEYIAYLSLFQDGVPLSEPVYIFMIKSDRQISDAEIKSLISSVDWGDWGTSGYYTEAGISSKFILRFISWIVGIVLVITALHKFDIYV
jgi:hypothetical protein